VLLLVSRTLCPVRARTETPNAVTAVIAKVERAGRVFIDWSQNHPAKTTIAPYSLRGRDSGSTAQQGGEDRQHTCIQASTSPVSRKSR
jgi:bifunctional non-homologous end joining protein LigD